MFRVVQLDFQQAHSRSDIGSKFRGWTTSRTKNRNVNGLLSLAHMEGITLGAGEEVDEVAGGAIQV